MTDDEIRVALLDALLAVAPEIDADAVAWDLPLRRQVELDSVDWLGVLARVAQSTGVDVPEADYARVSTLDAMLSYVRDRS